MRGEQSRNWPNEIDVILLNWVEESYSANNPLIRKFDSIRMKRKPPSYGSNDKGRPKVKSQSPMDRVQKVLGSRGPCKRGGQKS